MKWMTLNSAYWEMASFGPGLRSRNFEIIDVALLRLRFQNCCGLGLNQNLPSRNGRCIVS